MQNNKLTESTTLKGWKCRICGCNSYIHNYDTYYCACCSTVFKSIWMFNLDKVMVKLLSEDAVMPKRMKTGDVGFDLTSIDNNTIDGHSVSLIHTGIAIKLPDNTEAQIRTRSGFGKKGIIVANSPGTIDSGYTGEICVLLYNTQDVPFVVTKGTRIAQMLITPKLPYILKEVKELPKTERGDSGFGSTGE